MGRQAGRKEGKKVGRWDQGKWGKMTMNNRNFVVFFFLQGLELYLIDDLDWIPNNYLFNEILEWIFCRDFNKIFSKLLSWFQTRLRWSSSSKKLKKTEESSSTIFYEKNVILINLHRKEKRRWILDGAVGLQFRPWRVALVKSSAKLFSSLFFFGHSNHFTFLILSIKKKLAIDESSTGKTLAIYDL